MRSYNDIEIMSPVGSYQSLMAAIQGGCSSVYFGIGHLNMRSRSSVNFNIEDLKKITSICEENNVKSYLTLNTVIYDDELDEMKTIVDAAIESNITAIICSDHSVIDYARKKGQEIHISTQLNVSNIETVRYYSQFADVIVLARELNLKQVADICLKIEKEDIKGPSGKRLGIEIFVHGALCMAISGKCYLSLDNKNYSANRGACLQLCRRAYTVKDKDEGFELDIDNKYIMSPKDLCTIGFLDKILAAGVKVLKIEGRGRAPEYVKTVTRVYREAINAINNNQYTAENIESWKEQLDSVFNRGFWDGYYLGRTIGEWTEQYGSAAKFKKVYIGKINNYFSNINVAELKIETGEISIGDNVLIIGPSTGVVEAQIGEIRVELQNVTTAHKSDVCSIPINTLVRRNDKLYKLISGDIFGFDNSED